MFLTLEMVSGILKSFPPCILKPQGPGPASDTLYALILSGPTNTLPRRRRRREAELWGGDGGQEGNL